MADDPLGIIKECLSKGYKFLPLYQSMLLAAKFDLPVPRFMLARSVEDLDNIYSSLEPPLAAKISSPDILHKTEVKGVVLNVRTLDELKTAFHSIMSNVRRIAPSARVEGVVVQEMVGEGYEVIVGGLKDRQFGPVVAFGLGGIFVEVLRDMAFDLAPISKEEAYELIRRIRGYRILLGYRGRAPADIDCLGEVVSRASHAIYRLSRYVREMDLNPVIVLPEGCWVVDSRFVLDLPHGR